jgi:predicted dehydrogenase
LEIFESRLTAGVIAEKFARMKTPSLITTRRSFLKSATTLAAASTLPAWFRAEAEEQKAAAAAAGGDQIRFALIGCGGQGTGDARNAQNFGKVVAVCDVDESHVAAAKKTFAGAEGYSDFRKLLERKDVDAVICGTCDHWHTLVSMAAMKAGKDVYCEKPLTLTIDEGKRLVEVHRKTGRVLQTGTQQRSSQRFRLAVDVIRNGRIGKLERAEVWLPAGLREGPFQKADVPAGFNFDFWMGSTPKVDYVKERTHRTFRYWWDYSGGTMTDWGAHHNDIVLWALDMDSSGPVSVEGKQLVDMIPGGYTAASDYEVTYTYANGFVHSCKSTHGSSPFGARLDPKEKPNGIKFIGSDGWVWVSREELDASKKEILADKLPDNAPRVFVSNNHMGNFVDCIKTRKAPICSAVTGHRSATIAHLGTTAIRLGRKLNWDPVKEEYVNDPEAMKYIAREMRKPYDYDMI